ncbi:MAG: TetR/AcrR family transcriptional regulator [Deltaproteobacteria bacterium]|nr:TetR/AcrR family transcriptional regulator [Deltaproteobacteria bacterium]
MRVSKVSKAQIIERARSEFISRGFNAVRIDDIAAALGMSKKTFYRHFASKEDLVRAVVVATMDGIFADAVEIIDGTGGAFAKINALIEGITRRLAALSPGAPAELQRSFPAVFEEMMARRHKFLQRYVAVIANGQRRREVRRDYSPQALCSATVAVIEALGQPSFFERSGLDLTETAGLIRDFLIGGLSSRRREVPR